VLLEQSLLSVAKILYILINILAEIAPWIELGGFAFYREVGISLVDE
jgi:hypothetical protein